MSKISADTVEAKTTNGDLVLQGNGTGVPDLASGTKLNGTALTDTFSTQSPANPNLIINGDMRIAQRGTSFATISSSQYTLDRWRWRITGAGVVTVTQDTDTPTGDIPYSIKTDVTTADATLAASDTYRYQYAIEGYDIANAGLGTADAKDLTISFWVKSTKTGTFYVSLRNSAVNRSYAASYTVNTTDTWEYKTVTIAGDTTGTWLTTNGVGAYLTFTLATGSNGEGTAGSWQAADVIAASDQVNAMDNIANNFLLANVKLEVGSTATAFVPDDYGTALAKCQRYYIGGNGAESRVGAYVTSGNNYDTCAYFPVQMRGTPTVTLTNNTASNFGAAGSVVAGGSQHYVERRAASGTGQGYYASNYTADAEL